MTTPRGERNGKPCECSCHEPGANILHMVACCKPAPEAATQDPNDPWYAAANTAGKIMARLGIDTKAMHDSGKYRQVLENIIEIIMPKEKK